MAETAQNGVKITIIESPINQISTQMLEQKLQSPTKVDTVLQNADNDKFKSISKRLQSNIRKIESIEHKYQHSHKQSINFKMLRNTLVNNSIQNSNVVPYVKGQRQSNLNNYGTPTRPLSSYSKSLSKLKEINAISGTKHNMNTSGNKPVNLQTCLKELKDIKRTIKDLKQTCQDGSKYVRKSGILTSQQHSYRSDLSLKKYMPSSVSKKHSYTKYHEFSHGKSNRSQDRLHYSDKKFSWLKSPSVQKYTIDASNDEN